MDDLLHFADEHVLDRVYSYLLPQPHVSSFLPALNSTLESSYSSSMTYLPSLQHTSLLPRDSMIRQTISIFFVAIIGALILYFTICSLSYYFLFDKRLKHHPRFLKNQIWMEIKSSMIAAPVIDFLTLPWFLGEVRGYSKMYDRVEEYGWPYLFASCAMFLFFTDLSIYWIHRLEHHPLVYKHIHKAHHKWIMPTPWSALAFNPLDGYFQSLPYHIFVFLVPMHKYLYLVLFVLVQAWTILIHDGDMISGHMLERYINSPAHHTLHHLYFTCNYGQYFTWADSQFGSYRPPQPDLDPLHESLRMMRKKGLIDEQGNPIPQKKEQ